MEKKILPLKKNIKQMLLRILAIITALGTVISITKTLLENLNFQILWMKFCIGFSLFLIGTIIICLISDVIDESKQKRLMLY